MLSDWIGADAQHIVWWQMCIRTVIIFLFGLIIIRLFGRKAFGKQSSVDIVFAIVVGSNLSRTLTANAPFVPTLCSTLVLVLCFWSFGHLAARCATFSRLESHNRDDRRDPFNKANQMQRSSELTIEQLSLGCVPGSA